MRLLPQRRPLPPAEYLKQLFDYDADTGHLIWKPREDRLRNWNNRMAGRVAGCLRRDGYLCVNIDGAQYAAHRIVWKIIHGVDPVEEIDHIDGNKINNRGTNLRAASRGENMRNSCARGDFAKGVYQNVHGAFVAQIKVDETNTYLGAFDTEAEAHAAYAGAAAVLFGEFACTHR